MVKDVDFAVLQDVLLSMTSFQKPEERDACKHYVEVSKESIAFFEDDDIERKRLVIFQWFLDVSGP